MQIVVYSPDCLGSIAAVAAEKGRVIVAAKIAAIRVKLLAAGVPATSMTEITVSEKLAEAIFANGG